MLAFVLAIAMPRIGMLVYGGVGLITAALFLVCAAWDFVDKTLGLAVPPFLLVIFGLWNGWSSIDVLTRLLLNRTREAPPAEPFQ